MDGPDQRVWHSRRLLRLPDGRTVSIGEDGRHDFEGIGEEPSPEAFQPMEAYQELAGARFSPCAVEVAAFGAPPEFLQLVLRKQGVQSGRNGALRVVVTDDYLRPEVAEAVEAGGPCLLAKPVGRTLWVGPYLDGDSPVCFGCLRWWLTLNRYPQNALLLQDEEYAPDYSVARLPSTEAMAAGWIGTLVTLLAAGVKQPELEGGILHFDTVTQRVTRSALLPNGECPKCGGSNAVRPPISRYEGRYAGIVQPLAADRLMGSHVFTGRCMLSYPRPGGRLIGPQQVGGKGKSAEEARDSCAGEGLERYALVWQGNEKVVSAAAGEVGGMLLGDLLLFSESQAAPAHDPAAVIPWVEAISLSGGSSRYVPAEYVYFWTPEGPQGRLCIADSTGCACGADLVSAQLSGLLELVERDAVAIWWYNRVRRPALDVAASGDSRLRETVDRARAEGWSVSLLDVTTDLAIPAYVACLRHRDGWFAIGSAADFDPAAAAGKALAEAALVEFWSRGGGRELPVSRWLESIRPERHPQIVPEGTAAAPPSPTAASAEDRLRLAMERLRGAGIPSYFVNLTRPETQWPVVRVVAPGLRHFDPRFGPGRLYDVPVRLGWLARPRREEEMEPTPFRL